MRKICLSLSIGLLYCSALFSQDFSNKGKEFWIPYSYHVSMNGGGGGVTMTLYITSDLTTTYQVEIYGGTVLQTGTINAGQVVTCVVPNTNFISDEGLFTGKTVRVTAVKPVVVYSYITQSAISGATVCLPTIVLGKEYYSMNYTQVSNSQNSNSYFTIIAVEDNTAVEITPTGNTKNGWLAGNTYTVNLNKGQIYQVLGTHNNTNTGGLYYGADLTGSKIKSVSSGANSCKRIAVFSGAGKIRIGVCTPFSTTSDNLYQQLYPAASWGKKYLTVPSYNRPTNYYRILKSDPTTNVYLNGVLIPPGSFFSALYYEFSGVDPSMIEADKPISVTQYFTTQGCSGNASPYDPEMIVLNPVEQNINKVTLVSSNLVAPQNQQHHLHIIMRNGGTGISSFKLDGVAVPTTAWVTHPADPNYSYLYRANVTQGYHTLTSDSGFNALAYGYANAESYGYSAGSNVKDLYQFITIQNPYSTVNFPGVCKGTPFYFSIVFPYQPLQIQWVFGTALNAQGIADVTIANPLYDSTWFVNGKQLFRYKLTTPYTINTAGSYTIQVNAQNPTPDGCGGTQEIAYDLQVFDPPTAGFYFTTNGCANVPVQFFDTTNSGGRPIITWQWSFGDATTSGLQNPTHQYTAAGSYNASLTVITDVGCISNPTTKVVNLAAQPVANFGNSLPTCIGSFVTFSDSSSISSGAITKWTWNFGDGSPPVIATTNTPQTHIYATTGPFTVTLLVEATGGCLSNVFSKPITIHPRPLANFALPNVCLPLGAASFTSTSTVATGTIANYLWNFGNSQTATTQTAATTYSSTGPFNVTLTVTSNNGCVDDTIRILNTVYSQPLAAFTSLPEVCFGTTANFTDNSTAANSTVTQWLWDFGDGTTSILQNPTKNYSAPGTYIVTLTCTSAIGCPSTVATRTIVVNPLPTPNFNTSLPSCATRNITFTDISSANAGSIVKWTWDFADATNTVLTTGNPFIHTYATAGTYNVTLQVETNKGCISTILTKPVTVFVLPVAGFISPEICLVDPFAPFIDTSTIAVGTIASWQWNFGDPNATILNPNTSLLQNPTHRYTTIGNYTASLIVISNQGCTDTVIQSFFVNGSIPIANFTVQNANVLCSSADVVITDNSSVDFGAIVKVEIYWDYLNNPTIKTTDDFPSFGKNYSHSYGEFGNPFTKTYTIRMVSYSGSNCLNVTSKIITVLATPTVFFTPLSDVCTNTPAFQILQAGITNVLPGIGVFTGPGVAANGFYNPSIAGAGTHIIRYTYTGTNGCSNFKEQPIILYPTPIANAGPDKILLEGATIPLDAINPNVTYPITYLWTPAVALDTVTKLNPMTSPLNDITYTLTVTSDKGCTTSDQVFVKVLKYPLVPNIFSPNGDGIHDKWFIGYLNQYMGCTVEIFNRYGQSIFYSVGYSNPWDGTVNGKPVPVGTYYYIIDPKNGRKVTAGYVDVIR